MNKIIDVLHGDGTTSTFSVPSTPFGGSGGGSSSSAVAAPPELGGSKPTISVADASAMQVIIDAGSVEVGQLFKLATDGTLRRFEGGSNSRIIEKYYNDNPTGYATMTSVKRMNIVISAKHDGVDGATGICYSADGGTPVYQAEAVGVSHGLSIPHNGGAPVNIAIWSATSATSGRVGNLTYLYFINQGLTSLDVSGLTALTTLYCGNNSLTSLDVSGLTALTTLSCSSNQLTSLDVTSLTALTTLYCTDNSLTSLNVSGLTALNSLHCTRNSLPILDVSGLTALTTLVCMGNQLTSLDVSGLTALTQLYCHYNSLTSLDVSGLTALTQLVCNNNLLTNITAVGFDGSFQAGYHYGDYYVDFKNNQLTTDALYSTIDQMAVCNPATVFELDGNPCEINNVLQDGVTYTAAQLSALATSKSLTLILN